MVEIMDSKKKIETIEQRDRRKRGKQGFTLAEMLIAMLIMSFAGLIVSGGIATVTRCFQDIVLHCQTQMVFKEYMSEVRAGFLSAELDSALEIDTDVTPGANPAFTHAGLQCVGYYNVTADESIVFQPTYYDYDKNEALKTVPSGVAPINPVQLISTRLSDDCTTVFKYHYDNANRKFVIDEMTVKSKGLLSSGEPAEISVKNISISPNCG